MIVFWLKLEMLFWQDVSSFIYNNRNLSSRQPPKKWSLISSVSLNYSKEGLYYLMKNCQNQERLFLGYMKVSIFQSGLHKNMDFRTNAQTWTGSCFVVLSPSRTKQIIHTARTCTRKPQCCHQLKENAHSSGTRHRHTSDAETEVYESTSSDKISWYSRVV